MYQPTIYVLCPDNPNPHGGTRILYRHVDVLNSNGFHSSIVHNEIGFRCRWFENDTRVSYASQMKAKSKDFLVTPEMLGPKLADLGQNIQKVIFNQNAYYTFRGYSVDPADLTTAYTDPRVVATLVGSEDSRQYLAYVFPRLRLIRIRYSIDPKLFYPPPQKKLQICYMPRKHADDALQVINLLKFRGQLRDFPIVPVNGLTESQTAAVLRESLVFLSFGFPEGFGLPPLEAIACGCLTIGYHGFGGAEYFTDEFAWPVPAADVQNFARTVEQVLHQWRTTPKVLAEKASRAAAMVISNYSPADEVQSIISAWSDITQALSSKT